MSDRPLVVDSHQHFWDTNRFDYFWMAGPDLAPLRRPIGPDALEPLLRPAGVDATVTVQALQSVDETRWLLEIAAATPFVAGVVGWVDLTDPNVGATLAALQARPAGRFLVGIRHMVQDEPDPNWLVGPDVRPGLQAVADAGLAYDLLLKPPQIAAATRLCAEMPDVRFVVDHLAKPDIAHGGFDRWSELMAPFGAMPHVWCKLSGMVTEADWTTQTAEDLKPYVARALDLVGEDRVMFGSDWPVSTLACPYGEVKQALETALGPISAETRAKIFGGNATRFYGLEL
ncbi:MAG TPA: amidohydrolase family protein [Thermomicrobiales bacterium]|jgi:L-fuconolactonase|nr:amidohydrolase family protein [Thermomicrobiales bacterium]